MNFYEKNSRRKAARKAHGDVAYRNGRKSRKQFANNGAFMHLPSVAFVSEGGQKSMTGAAAYVLCTRGTHRQITS